MGVPLDCGVHIKDPLVDFFIKLWVFPNTIQHTAGNGSLECIGRMTAGGRNHCSGTAKAWIGTGRAGINHISILPVFGIGVIASGLVQFLGHGDDVAGVLGEGSVAKRFGDDVLPCPGKVERMTGESGGKVASPCGRED